MRYILCAVSISALAILFATVTANDNEEEGKNMLKQMAADCIEKTGATDDDVTGMCNKKPPTTKTGKCLAFCMMNQFNCIDEHGVFKQEDFMDLMKMASDNETMIAMCDEVSKKCVGTKDPNDDNCETAALILKCLDDGAKEAGYDKM